MSSFQKRLDEVNEKRFLEYTLGTQEARLEADLAWAEFLLGEHRREMKAKLKEIGVVVDETEDE